MIRYQQSGIEAQKLDEYVKKLADYFEKHQPYLKSDLNMRSVADLVDIKPNYISQAINRHFGCGFNDFVNSYRIDLAKEFIIAPNKRMFTIEAIAEEVGFKSKPTFNTAFKKKEGITPSEYRRQQLNGEYKPKKG
uniref:helix-turn-helix domain-containing protein n=1 Tax=Fulvivirga sp. TaxID=1931237 RepID=UPI004048EBF7